MAIFCYNTWRHHRFLFNIRDIARFPSRLTMLVQGTEKRCHLYCCSSVTLFCLAMLRLLPIELLSFAYAIWVFAKTGQTWLMLAKYHGFSINICLILLLLSVLRNIKSVIFDSDFRAVRYTRATYQRLSRRIMYRLCHHGHMRQRRMHNHEFYSYRLLFSSLVHTLVHAFRTHVFNTSNFRGFRRQYRGTFARLLVALPRWEHHHGITDSDNTSLPYSSTMASQIADHHPTENPSTLPAIPVISTTNTPSTFIHFADFPETLFIYDRWTVTGYLLLVFFILELSLGLRLMKFLARHIVVLLVHRVMGTLIILLLLAAHHTHYFFTALPVCLFVIDYFIGVYVLTHPTQVNYVLIYPNITSLSPSANSCPRNNVLEINFDVISDRFAATCKPGDYIAVKIPRISRWQWHNFTLMKCNSFGVDDARAARSHLHNATVSGRKILVRCVGKWTNAILNHRDNNLTMIIKGPYRNKQTCTLTDLLSRPVDRLVFISTGTAITHHISLLNGLIDEYWLHETTKMATGCLHAHQPLPVIPCEIRLVWIVRHSTDINFAITTLNDIQRLLARRGMDGLLVYDIWVTCEPTLNELELNTRLQTYLSSSFVKKGAFPDSNHADRYANPVATPPVTCRNRLISLHSGMKDVSQQLSFSLNDHSRWPYANDRMLSPSVSVFTLRHSDAQTTSAGLFDFFYNNAEMHTGVRPSWNKLCAMVTNKNKTIDAQASSPLMPFETEKRAIDTSTPTTTTGTAIDHKRTLVLLNTSVESLRLDIERLALSEGFALLTEDLWC